jgi:hypothetical protein
MNGPLVVGHKSSAKGGSVFIKIWNEVEGAMSAILDKVTFKEICESMRSDGKVLMYQI